MTRSQETNSTNPEDSAKPRFPVRPGREFLFRGNHFLILNHYEGESLTTLVSAGLTRFERQDREGLITARVPDGFVPFGRRLNSAGEDHFKSELDEGIRTIRTLLGDMALSAGVLPSGNVSLNDFGFHRADANADIIPPYHVETIETLPNHEVHDRITGITLSLLKDIISDDYAIDTQRTAASEIEREYL